MELDVNFDVIGEAADEEASLLAGEGATCVVDQRIEALFRVLNVTEER